MKNNYDIVQPVQSYSIHRSEYAIKYGAEKDITSAEIKTQVGTIIELEDIGEEKFKNGESFFGFRYRYYVLAYHKILSEYQPGVEGTLMSTPDPGEQSELEFKQMEEEEYVNDKTTQKSLLYLAYSNERYETSTRVFVRKNGSYLVIDGTTPGSTRTVIYNGRALSNQIPCDIDLKVKEEGGQSTGDFIIEPSVNAVQSAPTLITGEEAQKIIEAQSKCNDEVVAEELKQNIDIKTVPAEDAAKHFKAIFKRKGYTFYEKGDYKLNMIGIRSGNRFTNAFDDVMHLLYKVSGQWVHKVYKITTDPGRNYLIGAEMKSTGAAILVPGQHKYKIGLHKKTYTALQPTEPQRVYRDSNKDMIYDFDESSIQVGNFGINIHRSNPDGKSVQVNKWSAGCQVFADVKEYKEFLDICQKSWKQHNKKPLMYTLLMKSDV